MSLAAFLLARLAEDEAECRREIADGYGGDQHESGWSSNRVIVECESKRKLARRWKAAHAAERHVVETFQQDDHPRAKVERGSYAAATHAWYQAMQIAAVPYADHSDYQQDWKP